MAITNIRKFPVGNNIQILADMGGATSNVFVTGLSKILYVAISAFETSENEVRSVISGGTVTISSLNAAAKGYILKVVGR